MRENFNPGALLDIALRLPPAVHRGRIITDNSFIGQQQRNSYREIAKRRTNLILDGSQLTLDEIVAGMGVIRSGDLVILTAFAPDKTGRYLSREDAQRRIALDWRCPVDRMLLIMRFEHIVGPKSIHVDVAPIRGSASGVPRDL